MFVGFNLAGLRCFLTETLAASQNAHKWVGDNVLAETKPHLSFDVNVTIKINYLPRSDIIRLHSIQE